MNGEKTCRAFLLGLLMLAAVPLAGCQSGEVFPFYQLEKREDYSEILYIDGVKYERNWGNWNKQAHYFHDGDQYTWTPAEGIGEQIGVCGEDDYISLKIYEVAGDENHIFLYTWPAHFYFSGTDGRLWMQENVSLDVPTAETVSSITVVYEDEKKASAQVDDPAMIAALLEVYNSDSFQTKPEFQNGGNWLACSLILHHTDYPFLQYEIDCRYLPEQAISYCRNDQLEWFVLPSVWCEAILEHGFPAGNK